MQDFFLFLKNPQYVEDFQKLSFKSFITFGLIYLLSIIPIGVILFFFSKLVGFEQKILALTYVQRIFYGFLLAPIFEELLFRLIYIFTKKNLIIFILTTVVLLVIFIVKQNFSKILLFSVLILIFLVCLICFDNCKDYFVSNFKFWFYFIAIIFAFLHIFNFSGITVSNLIFTPLFVIPQFILGIILGYLRIHNGFIYALLFHFLINSSVLFQF